MTPAEKKAFQAWLVDLRKEALNKGISAKTVAAALPDSLAPIAKVIKYDRSQPEKKATLEEYLEKRFTDYLIKLARAQYKEHKGELDQVHAVYPKAPEALVVALWANETNCGQLNPKYIFDVIPALVTLAHDGRRSEFFRGELLKALKIVDQGHITVKDFEGSWAGAFGQVQFMPSSFESRAVDFNKDGKKDIWHTHVDVFASAANYMQKAGWNEKETWGHPVSLKTPISKDLLGVKIEKSIDFWEQHGVRMTDGAKIPRGDASATASVIQPDGPGTQAYIVFDNFKVILKWNNSTYFATSVSLMYDKVRTTPQP